MSVDENTCPISQVVFQSGKYFLVFKQASKKTNACRKGYYKKHSFSERQECILKIRIRHAWRRKTGDKMDDATGELSSSGNKNVILHF